MAFDRNVGTSGTGTGRGVVNTAGTVETISDLKSYTRPEDLVIVQGYSVAGDGGGGEFYWDSTSTETADDALIIQSTGVTTGRWKRIYSGALNVKWFGAVGDGVTDDYPAFKSASDYIGALGGGRLYVPTGHYKFTQTGDSLLPYSNMEIYGDGYSSFIDSAWNTIYVAGMHPSDYDDYTSYVGAAISAGDSSVTLTTATDANNFTAGQLVILRSVATDSTTATAEFPSFIELVKVKSANGGTGVVEFEDPIEDAVPDPALQISTYAQSMVEGLHIHNLRLKADYTNSAAPLRLRGVYRSKIHDLWTEGSHSILGNGFTKSEVYGINSIVYCQSGVVSRLAEVKSGSYRSRFHDIDATFINTDASATQHDPISVGERSRNIDIYDCDLYAHNINIDGVCTSNAATRVRFKDVNVTAQNARYGVLFTSSLGTYKWDFDSSAHNINITLSGSFLIGLSFTDNKPSAEGLEVHGLAIKGTNGDPYTDGLAPRSIASSGSSSNALLSNINVEGPIAFSSTTDAKMHDSVTGWHLSRAGRTGVRLYDCTFTGIAPPQDAELLFQSVVNSTTANNVIQTLTLPADLPYKAGDRVRVRVFVEIPGARVDTVHFALATQAGVLFQRSFVTTTADTSYIEGDIIIYDDSPLTAVAYTANLSSTSNASVSTSTGVDTTTTDIDVEVQAWVVNAADSITIRRSELMFIPAEQGLL